MPRNSSGLDLAAANEKPMTTTGTPHPLPQLNTAVASGGATEAGNYFISNYPPFSFWSPAIVPDALANLERPPSPDTDLGLYVHIPFCRKRCHFCYFKVYTDKNSTEIRDYLDAVIAELRMLAAKPFVGGRTPRFVYFGGGTPSYLSPAQLTALFDGLRSALPWRGVEEVAFEGEPGTLNDTKLKTLKDLGVTRLSLGVENFNEAILRTNNRAHGEKEIDRAYQIARDVGFDQINIDLIAGMVNETPENWEHNIERTLALAPDSVTIYQMEIPFNTTIFKEMKAAGVAIAPVADWRTKRQWVARAFERLEAAGYTVGSAYTAVRDKKRVKFIYRDSLWAGADLIGTGVASFSHINGSHLQNNHDIVPYIAAVREGRPPVYRAMPINAEERLVRQLILQLKLGRVDPREYTAKHGVDILARFKEQFDAIVARGFATVSPDGIRLTRDALLQVDSLLPAFYLPQHRGARYA